MLAKYAVLPLAHANQLPLLTALLATTHERDKQTDGQTPRDGIGRAIMHSRLLGLFLIHFSLFNSCVFHCDVLTM